MATVLVDRPTPEIVLLTLNRPERLNAMTVELVEELHRTLDDLAMDREARVIVLTGAGRGFCAGHELSHMDYEQTVHYSLSVQETFADVVVRLHSVPQATVAAVNGPAAGGGLALALAADTRVCSRSARFNAAFVRIGLSGCDVTVSYLLPRTVGPTLAFEMMLTGRLVDADEALRTGLVLDVVPDGDVVERAMAVARQICANSPLGTRLTKRVMWSNFESPSLEAAVRLENHTQVMASFTRDSREALEAFVERRPARFRND